MIPTFNSAVGYRYSFRKLTKAILSQAPAIQLNPPKHPATTKICESRLQPPTVATPVPGREGYSRVHSAPLAGRLTHLAQVQLATLITKTKQTFTAVTHHARHKEPLPIIKIAERCVAGGSVTSQESGTRPGTPKAGGNHAYHLYTSLPGWWKWVAERRYKVLECGY
ncbi:hypothetical protein Pcinc_028283 [Petrolisthes cinctipes]|uniref:Uncharacterized protein n=1 Tax=Petrolisthes cinctipes TaxID=88211 RepID=A0AAE1F389_PETCI|nr:hypothetical protein Pcinc_028283 [Petrolisthes cinctipes]